MNLRDLPTGFEPETEVLEASNFSGQAAEALRELKARGYLVRRGLTKDYAEQIITMAREPSIREYCPKDANKRFSDLSATEKWLNNKRGVFLLVDGTDQHLVGYGWVGQDASKYIDGSESTFALRMGEASQGKGLATLFSQAIVFAAPVIYGLKNMWLATWASNAGAVHIYHKIGFTDVIAQADERPTKDGQIVQDVRQYMLIDNKLLQT